MDRVKAAELEQKLKGKPLDGWIIESLIDHGKSAAVFRARGRADETVAVKIFDDELIAKYGDDTQLSRIDRELQLVGKTHSNLVKILGGGRDLITGNHFIAMEYLPGSNLRKCLNEIPTEKIPSLVAQLASAAKFLEDLGLVHRDIKPENIILVDNFNRLVLLDLGVLRPISGSTLTDANGIQAFVGTLQYSSPEFLLRQEEPSLEGWRSLTFYQIGGVIHDFIMRRPLFAEYADPYARLVNAVQQVTPEIQNSAVPYYLVEVARCCLLKHWRTRLLLVGWDSFNERKQTGDSGYSTKQRVTNRGTLAAAQLSEAAVATPKENPVARERIKREVLEYLEASCRTIRAENPILPPLRIIPKTPDEDGFGVQFRTSPAFGLNKDLTIFFRVEVLDAAGRVIRASACGCSGPFSEGTSLGAECKMIFQGTHDGAATYAAMEGAIYDLIDQAQEKVSTDHAEQVWIACRLGA